MEPYTDPVCYRWEHCSTRCCASCHVIPASRVPCPCVVVQDPDPSIRLRAIDLIFQLVSKKNARAMVAELLNYLVVAPTDQKRELCSKILLVGAGGRREALR